MFLLLDVARRRQMHSRCEVLFILNSIPQDIYLVLPAKNTAKLKKTPCVMPHSENQYSKLLISVYIKSKYSRTERVASSIYLCSSIPLLLFFSLLLYSSK